MKGLKKKGAVIVATVLAVAQVLTGCSLGKAPTNGNTGSGDELQIGVVAKGYGEKFARQLAAAYEAKTGVKTSIVKSSAATDWVAASLLAGEKTNDIDVYFDINPVLMKSVATSNYIKGYERAFVDLSDIYDEVPEGYGTEQPLEEMISEYALRASTWDIEEEGFGDGKQYFVCYASGIEGLVYNVKLFEQYGLKKPKTTTQFFALLDQIKTLGNGTYVRNDDGRDIYPYVYSGQVNYTNYLATVWWAQCDGVDSYYKALQGKEAGGNYTADSVKAQGKLSAMMHVAKLLDQTSGYTSNICYNQNFTNAQVLFLDNQAFMMSTGEWLEREMSANFDDVDVAFMKIPVNSDIIMRCDSVTTEEQLVECLTYIDGETDVRPSYLSDSDLAILKEARSVYNSEGNQHLAYIPAYSNMKEEAKDFLRFMVSKEGQEIMLEYSYGNMAPLNVDVSKFDYYDKLSTLQKSKYALVNSNVGITLVGNNYSHPMAYAGTVQSFYDNPTLENAFGVVSTSSSFKTPKEIWNADYERMAADWEALMAQAGVSN